MYPTWVQKNSIEASPFRFAIRPKSGLWVVQIVYGEMIPFEKVVAFCVGVSANDGPLPPGAHDPPPSPMELASSGPPEEPETGPEDPEEDPD